MSSSKRADPATRRGMSDAPSMSCWSPSSGNARPQVSVVFATSTVAARSPLALSTVANRSGMASTAMRMPIPSTGRPIARNSGREHQEGAARHTRRGKPQEDRRERDRRVRRGAASGRDRTTRRRAAPNVHDTGAANLNIETARGSTNPVTSVGSARSSSAPRTSAGSDAIENSTKRR